MRWIAILAIMVAFGCETEPDICENGQDLNCITSCDDGHCEEYVTIEDGWCMHVYDETCYAYPYSCQDVFEAACMPPGHASLILE